jgi:hypothetical protein
MAWTEESIKDFLGQATSFAVAPSFREWDTQSELHGAEDQDEEDVSASAEETEPAPPLAPPPPVIQPEQRVQKRLKLVTKISFKPKAKAEPLPPQAVEEYGAGYDYGLSAQPYGGLGLDQFLSGTSDSAGREGDTFKTMSREHKMRWFDQNGSDLLRDSSDENFRRLFGCGRGRTPAWKESFQNWCVKFLSSEPLFSFPSHFFFFANAGVQGTSITWKLLLPHLLQISGPSLLHRKSRAFFPSFSLPWDFPVPALWMMLIASSRQS